MTWTVKVRGAHSQPISRDFLCDECGPFSAIVEDRDAETHPCPDCSKPAPIADSPVMGRVRLIEAVKGRWEKPERKTWLDTRNLGEGQSAEEFRAERKKVWRDHRMNGALKEFLAK